MRHLHEVDSSDHTVIMLQVENEVGVLGDSRDRSALADRAFAGPVPRGLIDHLLQYHEELGVGLRAALGDAWMPGIRQLGGALWRRERDR